LEIDPATHKRYVIKLPKGEKWLHVKLPIVKFRYVPAIMLAILKGEREGHGVRTFTKPLLKLMARWKKSVYALAAWGPNTKRRWKTEN